MTFTIFVFIGGIAFITQSGLASLAKTSGSRLSGDYTLSIAQLGIISPVAVLANTVLTLFFFLEIASTLVFYNFIATRSLLNPVKPGLRTSFGPLGSTHFFNLLFFQF